ncbi:MULTISPECIES: hypothetical protein [Actinomadura]|uniref:hypothetical protein n=1 Tax=Actinomadura TaxID=1988 RepID=UPI0003FF35B6|nr:MULTISPECIES: hypothetical protein [Actinomadura]RSN41613.1 hypothetical protein DMH08_39015 [Actinomadura sp. WAC 06369]
MFIAFTIFVLGAAAVTVAAVLWSFARASRRDALFLPASDRSARLARRVTGMYVRDDQQGRDQRQGRDAGREGELVGR